MKRLQIIIWVLAIGVMMTPGSLKAQPTERSGVETVQLSEEQVRAACAARRYDLLPIPFSDVSPTDWAYEAVMNLYYCIGLPPQVNSNSSQRSS